MSGFEFLGDNFGREFPKPYGTGLESVTQPRLFGGDLLKVQDPQVAEAWVVADQDSLMEVEP